MKKRILVLLFLSINLIPLKVTFAEDYSHWMADYSSSIGNVPLNKIIFLGSHDSGSYAIESVPYEICQGELKSGDSSKLLLILEKYKISRQVGQKLTKAQPATIFTQLSNGIRYFDFRVCFQNHSYYASHGILSSKYDEILQDVISFLQKNNRLIA